MTSPWNTPRGYVDVRPNEPTAANSMQSVFKSLYDAAEHWHSVGYVERVALNYGSGGTGTDFYDGANPFGSNAWFTYKFPANPRRPWGYYMHAQWSSGLGNFGQAPGYPGILRGDFGRSDACVGIQFALALDANYREYDAWNGTSNFDGADTKGAPIWTCPSNGSCHVFPRSNNTGGAHSALKHNFLEILDTSTRDHRLDFLSDGDHVQIWLDFSDDQFSYDYIYFGPYKARTDVKMAVPFVCARHNRNQPDGSGGTTGDLPGTAFNNGGLLLTPEDSVSRYTLYSYGNSRSDWANRLTPEHDFGAEQGLPVYPMQLGIDSVDGTRRGIVGETYARRWGYISTNVATVNDVAPAVAPYEHRVYDYVPLAASWYQVMMWGGTTAPRATTTRAGVQV